MPAPDNEQLLAGVMPHIDGRAYLATGSLVSDAETIVRNAVSRGVSAGRSNDEIANDIYVQLGRAGFLTRDDLLEATGLEGEALDRLLGDGSEELAMARLNTAVRTNVFDAFNEARFEYFTDPVLEGFVEAFEYSAILDENTTDLCEELDGATWPADSELWNTYTPPNHFNCRSVLIPVVASDSYQVSEEPDAEPPPGFK